MGWKYGQELVFLNRGLGGGDWHLILPKFIIFAFRNYFLQRLCYKFEEKLFFPPPNLYDKKLRYLKMNLKISHKLR